MIKRLFFFIFLSVYANYLSSQNYGNEWIDYSQKYYRIQVPKTGIYRIDFTTLINSGIPAGSINPKNFQIFLKGEEQYIHVNGESDDTFNPGDYIEFFAKKNDGLFDSLAYHNITRLPNPYLSLFNDTNYVFLTWNSSVNNRRMSVESDVNFSGYTPATHFYSEKVQTSNLSYSHGMSYIDNVITDPRYITGEGFGTNITLGNSLQTNFGNLNVYSSASLPAYFKASFSGASARYNGNLTYDHAIKLDYFNSSGNYSTIFDTTFFGTSQIYVEKQIASSQLQNTSHLKISSEVNQLIYPNNTNIHYLYLKYPQVPDFSNTSEKLFFVGNSTSVKTFLDLQNVTVGSSSVVLYDLTNHKYISCVVNGSNVKALVPNSLSEKECFLTTSANVLNVTKLSPVNQNGFFINYQTSNPDSAFVIITHKSLQSSANAYKTYRQSMAGGSNHVIMADIDDLYDQFAYGNIKNPLAIKNFCRYLSYQLPAPPKYLLLIGKSIRNEKVRNNAYNWNLCRVPTMGNPSSDNLLTAGIHGANSSTPFIPVGRVSGKTDQEVLNYLAKVQAHEGTGPNGLASPAPPKDWHKHILHFSGGADKFQQDAFKSYLNTFGNIIKDTLFGGTTFSFQKTTTAPIQISVSDSVTNLINYGASLITFFGHGSVTGFDQAIDDPSLYNNKDKYPLFLANSCYSGDIHLPESNSTSEVFTLIPDKGSIGFIASSSSGLVSTLYYYTEGIYKSLGYETYFKGVGDAIKNTSIKTSGIPNQLQEITNLEMTLEGDPSIRINAFKKPDYVIENSYVSLDGFTLVDSIAVKIKIKNNGMAVRDSFIVKTERFFPNGDSISYFHKVSAPFYQDTLSFNIFKDAEKAVGLNHFKVTIDYYNEINELAENNNTTNGFVDLFISGGDVLPVFPYKYAIVPNTTQITLKASTADPFAPAANYILQLDTNDTFLNPIATTTINSVGGIIQWTTNLPGADSTVYFWRIKKDSTLITDRLKWRESSFQKITGKNGWSQAHFHQFKDDTYRYVTYLKPQRLFAFFNNKVSIKCQNEFKSDDLYGIQYTINTTIESNYNFNNNDGWSIGVFDSISTQPWTSSVTVAGFAAPHNNCLAFPFESRASFDFGPNTYCGPNPNWKSDLETFLNGVNPGHYILAYSSNSHKSSTFGSSLYQAFAKFGGSSLSSIPDTLPVIIFGKKQNFPYNGHEVIGSASADKITLIDTMTTKWNNGYIASEIIGPAINWNSLHWHYTTQSLANDSVKLKVIGIKANGTMDTLATFNKNNFDVLNMSSFVDASVYPKLKLAVRMYDDVFTPQLRKWQIYYDPVPECAINPQQGFVSNASLQAIQEGDRLIVQIPITNIGALPFTDSLLVTYRIEDAQKVNHTLPYKLKTKPFVPGQVILDTIIFNSLDYPGFNYLWVDVNPQGHPKYQAEQYHFNNIARIGFNVARDNANPLLDVTFDGTHILNGDIISSRPHVLVTLKDENKFLALDDTSDFKVFIKYPNQPAEKRLFFAKDLVFTKAQLPNNSCKIEWRPEFPEDGKYKLIVQANDRSMNVSGAVDYNIQFEIVNKQSVTEVLNYPNPFSTSTRFVFTLTGSEIPDIFTIQIMTITGKVVKEIIKDELGSLHIGRNITEYAWDGKDEFGDKLANGVYLYKVITRHNGQSVEKKQTDADAFFKKGIGKLVIIR
jgi:hypothetical protein